MNAAAPGLVVAVLTLNEQQNIRACLESLSNFDTLVVLDSGSSDATTKIAKSCGAAVLTHVQDAPFDIAAQRNYFLDHGGFADGSWVLFMDADERMTPGLVRELSRLLAAPEADAYVLTPKYLFEGRWMKRCLGYPNWHPRLVRIGSARFAGGVWEHFDTPRVGRVEEPYLHLGNSKGFGDWLERHDRYSSWESARALAYLRSGDSAAFDTERAPFLRSFAARFWRARPVMRFMWMYFMRAGFLDGWPAFRFCMRYAVYEYMITQKMAEARRLEHGKPL